MGNVAVNVAEYARWLPASNQCNIALCWALKYFIRAYSASLFVSSPREIISRCNHSLICVLQLFSLGLCLIRRCGLVRCVTVRQNVVEKFGDHFFFLFSLITILDYFVIVIDSSCIYCHIRITPKRGDFFPPVSINNNSTQFRIYQSASLTAQRSITKLLQNKYNAITNT
jgi:hypothetical protein